MMRQDFVAIPVSDDAIRWLGRVHSKSATAEDEAAFAAWRAADPEHEEALEEAEDLWNLGTALGYDPATAAGQADASSNEPSRHSLLAALRRWLQMSLGAR